MTFLSVQCKAHRIQWRESTKWYRICLLVTCMAKSCPPCNLVSVVTALCHLSNLSVLCHPFLLACFCNCIVSLLICSSLVSVFTDRILPSHFIFIYRHDGFLWPLNPGYWSWVMPHPTSEWLCCIPTVPFVE